MFFSQWASMGIFACVLLTVAVGRAGAHDDEKPAQLPEAHHPDSWRFTMPRGEPAKGKAVFKKFECYYCHEVNGEDFPEPTDSAPELSRMGPLHPPEFFAESVLNPSAVVPERYLGAGGKSPMSTDHIGRMTLQEWIDLTAYLASLKPRVAAKRVDGVGTVIALAPQRGEIVVDHGAIAGFMDAMTMGYKTASPQMLQAVKPGDKVRFTIDVERRVMVDIEKIQPGSKPPKDIQR